MSTPSRKATKSLKDLLGGKGANLAEMTNIGLPVPPGFTVSTRPARTGSAREVPEGLADEIGDPPVVAGTRSRPQVGQPDDPLLVSVRSGAKFSMPGMMETVLNVGLNDAVRARTGEAVRRPRFAWDSYRRLVQMFGKTVLGIER